ncbi:MAG: hypothetical protein ACKV2T_10590 [Kofleriaceae bacterium]
MHRLAFVLICVASVAYAQLPTDPQPAPHPPADPLAAPVPIPPDPVPAPTPSPPTAPITVAPPEPVKAEEKVVKTHVELDGYLQPQFRLRQDSSVQDDTNGFRFARIRPMIRAKTALEGGFELGAFFEVEFQPTFQLVDGFAGVTKRFDNHGVLVVDVGQMRVPISRQQLLSDSRIAFVDKAQIATIAPRRDLGGRVTFVPPGVRQVKVLAGMFNGEGPNQIENINQKFLYAGRVELNILGNEGGLAEGNFGEAFLTLAGSVGFNKLTNGDRTESVLYFGGDIAGAYKGLSGSFEYLYVKHTLATSDPSVMLPPDFNQNGWNAQLNYLLPLALPGKGLLEIGARLEEIDRNDTIPIVLPGEPEQSQRIATGVITYYVRKHSLKVQLALSHFQEIEDETVSGASAVYDNDQAMLQLTYRME